MDPQLEATLETIVSFVVPFFLGLLLLALGRRLTWLLAGLVFATVGLILTALILTPTALSTVWEMIQGIATVRSDFTQEEPFPVLSLLGAVIAGAIGIFATVRFPRAISTIVGFALGAFFLWYTYGLFALAFPEPVLRTILIVGGTIVAAIAHRQPTETMIILSTMLGSKLIVDATGVDLNSPISAFVWLISMLAGIIYQTAIWRREERKKAERAAAALVPAPVST